MPRNPFEISDISATLWSKVSVGCARWLHAAILGQEILRPMQFRSLLIAALVFASAPIVAAQTTPSVPTRALFDEFCVSCHNNRARQGDLSLEGVDPARPAAHAPTLEKVIRKLRAGLMPPPRRPRPDEATLVAFVDGLEREIDRAAAADPNPGRPVLHRLNRTEYANAMRDLLEIEVNAESLLPPDDMSQGYDNMSDVLTVSPALLEAYISAAGKISRMATGDPEATPLVETYVVPQAVSQMRHVPGAPFGTRGGTVVIHNFPADGEYVFRLSFYYSSIGPIFGDNIPAEGEQIEIAVNGERVALLDFDRKLKTTEDLRTAPIRIAAGPQTVSAAFIQRAAGPVQDFVMPFERALADLSTGHFPGLTGLPHLRNLGIDGPYAVTGVSESPSRRRVFSCRPVTATESEEDERACANEIIARLARRAFRRPITEGDLSHILALYETGRAAGDFESGVRTALQAILADPEFVFRFERTPAGLDAGASHRVTDLELASRLSFFLWSSIPDEPLLAAAEQGRLSDPAELERQVRRMLADPRSETLAANFASHWLRLQNLRDAHPDVFLFPDWDENLNRSMRRETELFFDSIVREDRPLLDLLTADYTFVDQRLATHYGIPNIVGSRFRRVTIADEQRRGLLGQAAVLTLTSVANRTSPVIRGAWILSVLLGTPPPKPPANVPPLEENETADRILSVRERMEEHRANAFCAACHNVIDPIGFSLENFDAVGSWRTKDSGFPVDPSGTLYDGTAVDGPVDLRRFLLANEDLFLTNFTRNLLMYATGRVFQPYDMPAVRTIVADAERKNHRLSAYVMGVVTSTPFQMRRVDSATETESVAQQ
jgi:mono/diheme cytochrome c family protein|tara:strand:+ start:3378 stop:5882 length:2505 start_codon:yes stop_codon:yes gene_type:complete